MLDMDCPGLPSQEGCLNHDSDAPDYQPEMPSQVRRLVSPDNPSYTPTENIVPAGLGPPIRPAVPNWGRTSSPRSRRRRRSLDSDVDMSHTWPALMADMGGTM